MFKSITLENFFSFRKPTKIELKPHVNILLGINGSGKSNFLKAIRFLYESISGNGLEKIFLKDWGGFASVANFTKSPADIIRIIYEFDKDSINKIVRGNKFCFKNDPIYEITIHKSGTTSYYLEEHFYVENPEKNTDPFHYLWVKNGKVNISASTKRDGRILIQEYPDSGKENSFIFKQEELVLRQISDPDRFFPLYTIKTAIESIAVYDYFDTTLSSPIRIPIGYGTEQKLLSTGENLVQVLHRLRINHSLEYEKIEELLKDVNPRFKDINFEILGTKYFLVLREQNLAKAVGVEHISDGTLRFLLLLSILFNPNRGYLVSIDEPETGLHPDMISTIAESIKSASSSSQMIIASHSPLLLNNFNLEDCLIIEKNNDNTTSIKYLSEEDFPDWDDDFLVGQLWLEGEIGAKRW